MLSRARLFSKKFITQNLVALCWIVFSFTVFFKRDSIGELHVAQRL